MKEVNDKTMHRALVKVCNAMIDKKGNLTGLTSSASDAGMVLFGKKGKREGFQLFIKAVLFSEEKLIKHPLSGGLIGRL